MATEVPRPVAELEAENARLRRERDEALGREREALRQRSATA